MKILEEYFLKSDPLKYNLFIEEMNDRAEMENRLITISAALKLKRFRIPEGDAALSEFGLGDKTIEQIERKISVLYTKFNMLIETQQKTTEGVANADFYHLKAKYQKTVGAIPVDVLLIEWLGIIQELREIKQNTPES